MAKKSSDELLGRLRIVSVADVVQKSRLRWYWHVDRKDVEDLMSKCQRFMGAGVGAGLRRYCSRM